MIKLVLFKSDGSNIATPDVIQEFGGPNVHVRNMASSLTESALRLVSMRPHPHQEPQITDEDVEAQALAALETARALQQLGHLQGHLYLIHEVD